MVNNLTIGVEVVSIGGIHGEVSRIKDDTIWMKVSNNVEIELEKKCYWQDRQLMKTKKDFLQSCMKSFLFFNALIHSSFGTFTKRSEIMSKKNLQWPRGVGDYRALAHCGSFSFPFIWSAKIKISCTLALTYRGASALLFRSPT